MLNLSWQTQPNSTGSVGNVQPIVIAKQTILLLDALHTLPRNEKWWMEGAKQEHRVKIHASISEYDSNNVVVMPQNAKPASRFLTVEEFADGSVRSP